MSSSDEHKLTVTSESIQALLDENQQLIAACVQYQNEGKLAEMAAYQKRLHQNLTYLAVLADKVVQPIKNKAAGIEETSNTL